MSAPSASPPEDGDWRITPQSELLRGARFSRKRWRVVQEGWDHDHCEFCWATFGEPDANEPERLQEGYATAGPAGSPTNERREDYYWVCEQCFEDLRERFEWTCG